jgi:hypothetical protein
VASARGKRGGLQKSASIGHCIASLAAGSFAGMEIARRLSTAASKGRLFSGAYRNLREFSAPAREAYYRWSFGLSRHSGRTAPAITMSGDFRANPLSASLKQAFDRAIAGDGKLPQFVRDIEGMSGQRYRTFINNLIGSQPDARYLEVGSWGGSTAASAICGNKVKAVCIDNWSLYGGPKSTFLANMERVRSLDVDFRFIESDFRAVDYSAIGRFNVYLFDGPHEERDQYDGIVVARPAMDDCFVLIIDDWNWPEPRMGTYLAIRNAGYSIACAVEVRSSLDGSHVERGDWHNGYFFAVLTKSD